jgi:hypothetical protein
MGGKEGSGTQSPCITLYQPLNQNIKSISKSIAIDARSPPCPFPIQTATKSAKTVIARRTKNTANTERSGAANANTRTMVCKPATVHDKATYSRAGSGIMGLLIQAARQRTSNENKMSDGWRERVWLRGRRCSNHKLGIGTASRSLHRPVRPWRAISLVCLGEFILQSL